MTIRHAGVAVQPIPPRAPLLLLGLAGLAFVSLGLPDGLLGVGWPSIRATFGLPLEALGSILLAFTGGYLLSSVSSGRLLARMGVGTLLGLSCAATAVALLGYALAPVWWLILPLAVLLGAGGGAIDAGVNTHVATHYGTRALSWLHAAFGVGAATGPLVMTAVLAADLSWRWGYVLVAGAQALLAALFVQSGRRWAAPMVQSGAPHPVVPAGAGATLRLPRAWLGMALFFLYAGVEVTAAQWSYSLLTEARGALAASAGLGVSAYWASLAAGRLLSGWLGASAPVRAMLRVCLVAAAVGAGLLWAGGASPAAYLGLALLGLALAPVFPSLVAETPPRLGRTHAANAIGFQIGAAVLGGAMLPGLVGIAAARLGLEVVGPALLLLALLLLALHEAWGRGR